MLTNIQGFWVWSGGGQIVSLHRLIGDDKFSLIEIRNAVLSGELNIGEADVKKICFSKEFEHYPVSADAIEIWLARKNKESQRNQILKLEKQIEKLDAKVDGIQELIVEMFRFFESEKTVKSTVTVNEVAKIFQDTYAIGTIRNMISANKIKKGNYWISVLKIMEYELHFRKLDGSKQWFAEKIDFKVERGKVGSYNFKQRLANLNGDARKLKLNERVQLREENVQYELILTSGREQNEKKG